MDNNVIFKLFPEPLFKYKLNNFKELNKHLSNYIYQLKDEDKDGLSRSNKGGWHSKNFKLGIKDSIQQRFAIEVQKIFWMYLKTMGGKPTMYKLESKKCGQL